MIVELCTLAVVRESNNFIKKLFKQTKHEL